ncbi:MAG: hypothetical protein B7Z30_10880 [Rhizobiales bacterium 12-68-15]|nr:MAG: hypothetical protein B7Z30_10880 [Rhizobiales bacterium 12-68-15]
MSSAVMQGQSGPGGGRRGVSIRRRAILLILLVSIPLISERMYSLYAEREAALAATLENLQQVAANVGLSQRETIAVATGLAQMLSRQAAALLADPPACDAFLHGATSDLLGVRNIMIAGPILSNFVVSPRTGRSLVSVSEAERNDRREVQAVAVVSLDLEWMSEALARAGSAPGVIVVVVDGNGVGLARYPLRPGFVGSPYRAPDFLASIAGRERGAFRDAGAGREARIYAVSRVPGTDVRVLASMREADAVGALDTRILATLATFLLVMALFIALALYLARRMIVAPINRLASGLLAYGTEGAQDLRDLRIREFEPILFAYEEMSRRLTAQTSNLRRMNNRLAALASTDGLTGLVNRRSFDVQFSEEWVRCADASQSLALVMMDVDHFKLFNDSKGHLAGDEALRRVADRLIAATAGTGHVAARYGGEEFIILLAATHISEALEFAETLRHMVLTLGIPHSRSPLGQLSASFGVAAMVPTLDVSPDVLLARVDAALYDAKRLGRNRVVGAREAPMPQMRAL